MSNEASHKHIIVTRYKRRGRYFTEKLEDRIDLDMVLIPGGKFLMGAPKSELESRENERPQHEVIIQPFFFGAIYCYASTVANCGKLSTS